MDNIKKTKVISAIVTKDTEQRIQTDINRLNTQIEKLVNMRDALMSLKIEIGRVYSSQCFLGQIQKVLDTKNED